MVDIFLVFLFLYLLFTGIHRGFVEIFIKVVGWGAGIYIAFRLSPVLSPFLSQYFNGSKAILDFFSFLFLFLPFLGFTVWLNSFIHRHIKRKKGLSFLNKFFGGVLSTVAFVVFIAFIVSQGKNYPFLKEVISSSKIIKIFHFPK